jgi:hypothetical protein
MFSLHNQNHLQQSTCTTPWTTTVLNIEKSTEYAFAHRHNNIGKNLDPSIKIQGSPDSTTDEEPIASMKPTHKKKTKMKTKSVMINNLPPYKAITGTSTASMNNQSASKTPTAAIANATIPGDVANVNLQKKGKQRNKQQRLHHPFVAIQSTRKI